jgi:uncharacterized protein
VTQAPTDRTRIRRHPERARYDFADVAAAFEAALVCHVGLVRDSEPVVLPMVHALAGDRLYLHGSTGAGLFRPLRRPERVCVTATVVDGAVFASSARNHSLNYRSAVVFGPLRSLANLDEKRDALRQVVEHLAPGRWQDARQPTAAELKETAVAEVVAEEWSAKVRTGPPLDAAGGGNAGPWSGVIPLALTATGPAVAAEGSAAVPLPGYLQGWHQSKPTTSS